MINDTDKLKTELSGHTAERNRIDFILCLYLYKICSDTARNRIKKYLAASPQICDTVNLVGLVLSLSF